MAKTVAVKKSFGFTSGLNTEAGPLNFPPNTWQDGTNVVPAIDGSLSRRLAVNYELGYSLSTTSNTPSEESNGAFVCDEWFSVAGDGSRNFIVVQRNSRVSFYDNTGAAVSATEKTFSIDLTLYKASGNPNTSGFAPISCASANGKLVITSADTDPILVSYSATTGTITVTSTPIYIRDLYGATDGYAVDERRATLDAAHNYNLRNQGWSSAHITTYFTAKALYPSNAQSWIAGKDTTDTFDATLLDKQDFGTSPSPRGRYLLNLFYRDRSATSGVLGIPVESELYRPTTCAFFAGRAWYAGAVSATVGAWVMFSQVADTDNKYGSCYQAADPTSEVVSDLVDTDGGVIPIQGAGTILKLLPVYNSMLVFADNGVWQIAGGLDSGFSATSYEVKKLSSVGCSNPRAVVEAESSVYFWAADGLWVISPGQGGLGLNVVNITDTTIQTLYGAIPIAGRAYASGRYYQEGKTIYWLYNSAAAQDSLTRRFKKNSLLCLDLRLKAFYRHSVAELASNTPYVTDLVVTSSKSAQSITYDVVDASNNAIVTGASGVTAQLTPLSLRNSDVRFLTVSPVGASTSFKATFARFEDGLTIAAKFRDWYSANTAGVNYDAYILTGYDLGNDQGGDRSIQALYATTFMRRTETGVDVSGNAINPSSCLLQARWDWTDHVGAGKWTPEQEVYRHRRQWTPTTIPSATYTDGYPVVVSKSKIRGRGKALQLKLTAQPDKDMQLLGWAVTHVGNGNV